MTPPEGACKGTDKISIRIKVDEVDVSVDSQGSDVHVSVNRGALPYPAVAGSLPSGEIPYTRASSSTAREEPPYEEVAAQPLPSDDRNSPEEDFELISFPPGHIAPDFYMKKMPADMPLELRALARRLHPQKNKANPDSTTLVSGLRRLEIAYAAGRADAGRLRGEDPEINFEKFSLGRSASLYIILKGGQHGTVYPCRSASFGKYKMHAFRDSHLVRPRDFHPGSVSHAFYSEAEAEAYCRGAGLPGLI